MQITCVRHLPTEWNEMSLLQGSQDIEISPISDEQRNKIEKNRILLKENEPYDLVVSSTLKRTIQSAELYHYKPKTEALLNELDFGLYEGLPKAKLLQDLGEQWVKNPDTIILGERLTKLNERITHFIKKYNRNQNILLFGHGCWIRAFLSYIQFGHINNMNKKVIKHNEPITVTIPPG